MASSAAREASKSFTTMESDTVRAIMGAERTPAGPPSGGGGEAGKGIACTKYALSPAFATPRFTSARSTLVDFVLRLVNAPTTAKKITTKARAGAHIRLRVRMSGSQEKPRRWLSFDAIL